MLVFEFTLRIGREQRDTPDPEPQVPFESQGAMVENAARVAADGLDARVGFTRRHAE